MQAIPDTWKTVLYCRDSRQTFVKTPTSFCLYTKTANEKNLFQNNMKTKYIYKWLIKCKSEPTFIEEGWLTRCNFNDDKSGLFASRWMFIKKLNDKKLATFLIKLMYKLLPCKTLLLKWNNQQANNGLCVLCNEIEDYSHLFCKCIRTRNFLIEARTFIEKRYRMSIDLTNLKTLVFGYKTRWKCYSDINYVLAVIYFTIFKYYCKEENRITMHMFEYEMKIRHLVPK